MFLDSLHPQIRSDLRGHESDFQMASLSKSPESVSISYFLDPEENQSANAFAFGVPSPVTSSQPTFTLRW
jgi:hypothetical protein